MGDENAEGAELGIKANLYWMFYHIYANRLINVKPNISEDKRCYTVRRALEYIRTEYMNDISIQQIAKYCGYSEFYTMKLFARCTGSSCVDYLNNVRLTAAAAALCTDGKIADAARDAGFNNISYFNKQFKRLFGKTPGQYRNVKKAQQP